MGPGGFFPTNPDLADILGRMDLNFENFYVFDLLDPKFLDSEVPSSPNSQISRSPDSQISRSCYPPVVGLFVKHQRQQFSQNGFELVILELGLSGFSRG